MEQGDRRETFGGGVQIMFKTKWLNGWVFFSKEFWADLNIEFEVDLN